MTTEIKDSAWVGFKLMDGRDMGDIIDIALEDNDSAQAELMPGGYWELDAEEELVIDLEKISAWLEQPFDEKDFLQYVSSFYGRVSVEDGRVVLRSKLMMVEDYQAQEARA